VEVDLADILFENSLCLGDIAESGKDLTENRANVLERRLGECDPWSILS